MLFKLQSGQIAVYSVGCFSSFITVLKLVYGITEDGKIKDDLGEFYHKPAGNIAQQRKADKLRERLQERREKRQLENK